jgi:hypothetical protein
MKSLLFVFILSVGLYPGNPSANTNHKIPHTKYRIQDSKNKGQDSCVPTKVAH